MPAIYVLVLIELNADMADMLRHYEQQAAPIMQRHGGRFVYVLKPTPSAPGGVPDEVHLLAFESEQGFAAFRADPDLHAIRHLRDAVVKEASVLPLHAIPLRSHFTNSMGGNR